MYLDTSREPGADHVVVPLETFWVNSPNGRHLCTVLPVLGPTISEWRKEIGSDSERTRKICRQAAEGLGFLHSKGLCHGDFRPRNILMKLRPGALDHLDRDAMCDLLGPPDSAEVRTFEGDISEHAPECVVTAAPWEVFK